MTKILTTKSQTFQTAVREAPKKPGVYIYRDGKRTVLYVGKAKILKNRVNSYFTNYKKLRVKIQQMIEEARYIEYYTVDTEVEALILETNLIKKYRPKYNTAMKDDKNFMYVRFEKVRRSNQPLPTKNSVYQDFPRITLARKKKNDGAIYFGPYPNIYPIKRLLKRLRKIFPYRTSNALVIQHSTRPLHITTSAKKPCFYYHIDLCKGACAGLETKQEYVKRYKQILKIFEGDKASMVKDLEKKMKQFSKELKFEEAAAIRNRIQDITYATAHISIDNSVDDVVVEQHVEDMREKAIDDLLEKLQFPQDKIKKHAHFRIECYDISNIQGTNATGSMVVQIDGEAQPSLYRRFKIQTKDTPDDFAMMQEVLGRRFNQLLMSQYDELKEKKLVNKSLLRKMKNWKEDESFAQKPDLIILDGGKGQLSAVYEVLKLFELDQDIPIVGLAKREEELFKIRGQFGKVVKQFDNPFERILLPRKTESLYLVQRIRDEAHRFAKSYHTKLRNKALLHRVEQE